MLAVPLAFKWFQNLDMKWVKIVVIFVVAYASITMLLTAYRERGTAAAARPASFEEAAAIVMLRRVTNVTAPRCRTLSAGRSRTAASFAT